MAHAKTQICASCGAMQELPAIFCGACHSPLLKISKLFLTAFLTLTVTAFVYYGLVQESLLFAWPLYSYYALLFVVLSYAVTRRHRLLTFRMVAWSTLLAYALWFFYLGFGRALTNLTSDIRDIIDIIEQDLFAMVTAGLVVVMEAVLAFVLLVKRFGFATGYRIYATFLAAGAFAARYAFSYASGETGAPVSVRLSDWFSWAPTTEVKELCELVAVNLMRAMLMEMAVTSFIKGYRPATEAFQRYAVAAATAPRTGPGAAMLDAAARLNAGLVRAALFLRHFFGQFTRALAAYLLAFGRTCRRLFLDLILPAGALLGAAFVMGVLTEHSAAYITGRLGERLVFVPGIRSPLAMMGLCILALFAIQLIFLAAVTKFPPRSLWRCNSLLLMWLAPFAVFLFVFVSLSLVATGLVVNRYDGPAFPYRLGPLTAGATVLLVLMIAYAALATRRTAARMAPGEPAPESAPIPEGQAVTPPEPVDPAGADSGEVTAMIPTDSSSQPEKDPSEAAVPPAAPSPAPAADTAPGQ